MAFNAITDFVGAWNISQSKYGNSDLANIILSTEEAVLKDLLGEDLYLKLIADCTNFVPSTAKYVNLVNGTTYTVVNGEGLTVNVQYKGIKDMLKYFCYAEMIKFQDNQASEVGQVEPVQNNSQRMEKNQLNRLIQNSYNKGVALYGYDIEAYQTNDSFLRGKRFQETVKTYTAKDYYELLVRGNCFNFLYKYHDADYPTWQFTPKTEMFFNGML